MRRFELVEGTASKFWEVEQAENNELNIRWRRIGTAGQSQTKAFTDAEKAQIAFDKLIKEKTARDMSKPVWPLVRAWAAVALSLARHKKSAGAACVRAWCCNTKRYRCGSRLAMPHIYESPTLCLEPPN